MSSFSPTKINKQEQNESFSSVLIKLLQGFIVSDEKKYWESLITYQEAVRKHFSVLGLQLHLSTDDGYAFLKQGYLDPHQEEVLEDTGGEEELGPTPQIPTLVRRIPLSFETSLLCVLLRETLEQFDSKVNDDHRLVLHRIDIYDLLKLFYEEKTDETKQMKRFDALINRVVELGFLKELKGNQNSFEVRRIIKAQFDAEKLLEIKTRMIEEIGLLHDEK